MMQEERRRQLKSKKPVVQIIRGLLDSHEEILWRGQPIPKYAIWSGFPGKSWIARFLFSFGALVAIQPFSLLGVFMAREAIQAVLNPEGAISIAVGILLMILGTALGIGPNYYLLRPRINAYHNAKYVQYVITNRRVMMLYIRGGQIEEERIKPLNAISDPWIKMLNSKGVGDVIYDAGGALHSGGDGPDYKSHYDIGFDGVANAKEVMDILQKAIRNHRARRANQANAREFKWQ